MVNSFDPSAAHGLSAEDLDLIARRDTSMGAAYRLFYERPLHIVSGHGATLVDRDGIEYLDAYNNVPVVGHSNAHVAQAVAAQLTVLNTHTRYLTDDVVAYAERLTALFPEHLSQVMLTCTGSEAVDLAVRIARTYTGRQGVVITRKAYHGTTTATAEVSPSLGPNNVIPDYVELVDAPDHVRDNPETTATDFASRLEAGIAKLQSRGFEPAAILLDSVFSSDGLQVETLGVLVAAQRVAHAHGALYIADEVQGGFGRTGNHWWAFQREDVQPDLVVLGKPMGNGMPIAGVVARPDLFNDFGSKVRYFNTFAGGQVAVAAANAVLDEIENKELLAHVSMVGDELKRQLSETFGVIPGVADVRGAGLFLAVELVDSVGNPDAQRAGRIVNLMRDRHILISASGTYDNVLKIRPPLVFTSEDAVHLVEALWESVTNAPMA